MHFGSILWAILAAASPSHEPGSVQSVGDALIVEPGASCLDHGRLASKVISLLGDPEVDLRIEVEIRGDPTDATAVRFEVRKQGEVAAERVFEFPPETSCDQKHAIVGVALALAIDATRVAGDDPEVPFEPVLTPAGPSRGPRPPRDDPPPPPLPPSPWSVKVGLGGGLSVASPPGLGGFGTLAVEFAWWDWVDLAVGALGGSSGVQDAGAGDALLSVVGGHGTICGGGRWRRIRPRGCTGVVIGAALATGRGFEADRTARVPWVAVTPGVDLRIRVAPRIELELGADAVVHLVRPAFDFLGPDRRRTLGREFGPIGGLVGLGVVFSVR
jgi:hypothetical protein